MKPAAWLVAAVLGIVIVGAAALAVTGGDGGDEEVRSPATSSPATSLPSGDGTGEYYSGAPVATGEPQRFSTATLPPAAPTQPPAATAATATPAGSSGGTPTTATPSTAISVTIASFSYSPATFSVPAGQAVTLTIRNNDSIPHGVTIENGPSSGIIAAGGSGSLTFTLSARGSVTFICPVHGNTMGGTITVL